MPIATRPRAGVQRMTIGALARRTGSSIRTLRFYDRLGILEVDGRSEGNYRLFTEDAIACVRCIRDLQGSGLTLRQIRRLVELCRAGGDATAYLRTAYREAYDRISQEVTRLEERLRALGERLASSP